jgi:hypothetical protein
MLAALVLATVRLGRRFLGDAALSAPFVLLLIPLGRLALTPHPDN